MAHKVGQAHSTGKLSMRSVRDGLLPLDQARVQGLPLAPNPQGASCHQALDSSLKLDSLSHLPGLPVGRGSTQADQGSQATSGRAPSMAAGG
jgi:hypothetical protein